MTSGGEAAGAGGAGFTLRPAEPADALALAEIFLAARHTSLGYLAIVHSDDDVRDWYARVLVPAGHVVVAERAGAVVGFADIAPGWLHHLYVAPSEQGSGAGSALFERATEQERAGFELWVFQRNEAARRFYARRGCVEVLRTDGADNEEREPDVLLRWRPPAPPTGQSRTTDVRD